MKQAIQKVKKTPKSKRVYLILLSTEKKLKNPDLLRDVVWDECIRQGIGRLAISVNEIHNAKSKLTIKL